MDSKLESLYIAIEEQGQMGMSGVRLQCEEKADQATRIVRHVPVVFLRMFRWLVRGGGATEGFANLLAKRDWVGLGFSSGFRSLCLNLHDRSLVLGRGL